MGDSSPFASSTKLMASVEESVPSGAGNIVELQAASAMDPTIPSARSLLRSRTLPGDRLAR